MAGRVLRNPLKMIDPSISPRPANTAPTAPDEDLPLGDATAKVLLTLLIIIGAASVVLMAQAVVVIGWSWNVIGSPFIAVVAIVSAWQLRRKRVRRAVEVLLWGLTINTLALPFFVAGIKTPALFALPTLCVMAGWLLGSRHAAGIAVASAVVLSAQVLAQRLGISNPNAADRPLETYLIILVVSTFLAMVITRAAVKSFQRQVQSIKQSDERFRALFRANPLPGSLVDNDGATLEVNHAWVALFGIAASEVQGRNASELGIWRNDEHRAQVRARLAVGEFVAGFPTTLHTVSGERHFLLYVSPVEFIDGVRLVTTLVDQTDRLAAEAAQRALTESLEERVAQRTAELSQTVQALKAAQEELVHAEKLASLGAMVAGISHELNTPIGNTLTMASTLKDVSKEFDQKSQSGAMRKSDLSHYLSNVSEMADLIERNARRAADLIASFKQVAVDRSSQRRREFNVANLVADVLVTSQPLVRGRGVLFTQDVVEDLTCDTYPGPVEQILTNFVQNAVLHGFGERDAGHIDIQVRKDGDSVVITVKDDGAGMSEHTLRHIFDPFFTTRLGQGGSGLGLSVSHHLAVAVLGGDLTAASQPGEGCTMTLRFLQRLPHSH